MAGDFPGDSRPGKNGSALVNHGIDPGELKRILDQACRHGGVDPGDAKRMLAQAFQEGGVDPRALKKMLARAHPDEHGFIIAKPWLLPEKKLLVYQEMDQKKREMEKQQAGLEGGAKPFVGIVPGF